jgi:hypothetical protein
MYEFQQRNIYYVWIKHHRKVSIYMEQKKVKTWPTAKLKLKSYSEWHIKHPLISICVKPFRLSLEGPGWLALGKNDLTWKFLDFQIPLQRRAVLPFLPLLLRRCLEVQSSWMQDIMVGGNSGNHDEPIGQPVPPYTFFKKTDYQPRITTLMELMNTAHRNKLTLQLN